MENRNAFERVQDRTTSRIPVTERVILVSGFSDRDALIEEPEADDALDIDTDEEESEGGEDIPQDVVDSDEQDFPEPSAVRPLWVLYGKRLLWASSNIGGKVQELEFFRRRLQALLDFLEERFPDRDDEDMLLAMRGLFVEVKPSSAWLDRLQKIGIVCGKSKIILPLSELRMGQGKSRPKTLERFWFDDMYKRYPDEFPLDRENRRKWIQSFKEFWTSVEDQWNYFTGDEEGAPKKPAIGLRVCHYADRSIENFPSDEWKKWRQEGRKEGAGE